MAEDRKVRITIETKADGTGAKAVAKSLDEVAASAAKVEQKSEASADAFQQLDAQLKKTQATSSQVLQSQSLLVNRQNAVNEALKKGGAQAGAAATGTRQVGAMAQQAGYQIQDFAVQVGSGTNALVAFAQQGSQLLGMLGPKGALIGAALAVGVAIYNSFRESGKSVEEAKKRAEELTDALMETAKAAGAEAFGDFADELEAGAEAMEAIYQATVQQNDALRDQAQAQFAIRAGWLKAMEAAIAYREATEPGFDAAGARSGIGADQRANKRDAAIAAEQGKSQAAIDQYNATMTARRQAIEEQQQALEARRAEQEAQQAQVSQRLGRYQEIAAGPGGTSSSIQTEINGLAAELEKIQTDLSQTNSALARIPQKLAGLSADSIGLATEVDAAMAEAATNIERINEEYNAEENAQRAKEATEKVRGGIEALQKFVEDFQPLNDAQRQAEQVVADAIQDGKLTADEILKVAQAMKTLQGLLKTGQEGNREVIDMMIALMQQMAADSAQQKKDLQGIKERLNGSAPIR